MQAYRAAKACKRELRDALQRQGGEGRGWGAGALCGVPWWSGGMTGEETGGDGLTEEPLPFFVPLTLVISS